MPSSWFPAVQFHPGGGRGGTELPAVPSGGGGGGGGAELPFAVVAVASDTVVSGVDVERWLLLLLYAGT